MADTLALRLKKEAVQYTMNRDTKVKGLALELWHRAISAPGWIIAKYETDDAASSGSWGFGSTVARTEGTYSTWEANVTTPVQNLIVELRGAQLVKCTAFDDEILRVLRVELSLLINDKRYRVTTLRDKKAEDDLTLKILFYP
jgi:hypothetical protein